MTTNPLSRRTVKMLAAGGAALALSIGASAPAFAAASYKGGTYSANGSYASPAGRETIRVTLKVSHSKVTSVKVTAVHVDPGAKAYESEFARGISKVVVGKKLSTLKVSRVAGSSLTSGGFNAAVATIRSHAKK